MNPILRLLRGIAKPIRNRVSNFFYGGTDPMINTIKNTGNQNVVTTPQPSPSPNLPNVTIKNPYLYDRFPELERIENPGGDVKGASTVRMVSVPEQRPITPTPPPSPTSNPYIKASPVPTPEAIAEYLGRSDKFKSAYNENVQSNVDTIISAAQQYGVSPELMLDIAAQESMLGAIDRTSGYHPTQRSASGLFQFVVPTWASYAQRYADELGIDVPQEIAQAQPWSDQWKNQIYTDQGLDWVDQYRMNPEINARMAALIMSQGGLSNWDASRHSWGPYYSNQELNPYMR